VSRQTDLVLPEVSGRIAGYRLERSIGGGASGAVYLARDGRLGRKVALKVVAPELADDAAFRARFPDEPRAAAAIGHPNIIPVYEAGEASGILYLAMRYAAGGDARSLVSRLGPLDLATAWNIVAEVASALDAAHGHGLIHRDVKPASMLLEASAAGGKTPRRAGDGVAGHVYLSGFGMGQNPPPDLATAAGQFAGALDYLAPEQIEGRVLDGRADLYSLACAGFELLCGTPPFGQDQGATVMYAQLYAPPPAATAQRPDLPAAVDPVLARALAKSPADRYPTCGQFAEELRTALGLSPGEPEGPVRLRSPAQDGPLAAAKPASGDQDPAPLPGPEGGPALAPRHESGPEPGQDPAPEQSGAGWLRSLPSSPEAEPGARSAEPVSGPGGPDPRLRRRLVMIGLILAVAAVAAAAVVVAHSNRPVPRAPGASSPVSPAASSPAASSAPPSPSALTVASRQAAAVDQLLGSSAAAREALQGAVEQVRSCTGLSGAVASIRDVVGQRVGQYNQASVLSTAALGSGAIVKSDLITALRDSLAADQEYLTWAQQELSSGCTPAAQSSAYNAAYQADQRADAAKDVFIQVWNPVAARYGVQQKSPGSI
jgi:serine/threonine protein kinase